MFSDSECRKNFLGHALGRRLLFLAAMLPALMIVPPLDASAIGPGGWEHVGNGGGASTSSLNGSVYTLATGPNGLLYAGGAFTSAGGVAGADHIATWNGSTWSALGNSALNGAVNAIAFHNGKIYAGGQFTNAGGAPSADFLAVWDGSTWAPFCGPFGGSIQALQIIGSKLYVGGSFQNGANINAADYLLECDLNTGAANSTVANDGDINGGVYALTADSNGVLYAGGQFINLAGIATADHIASYDGAWHALGGGVDSFVRSLTASGTDIYAGTDVKNIAGIDQADYVAKWNGSFWSALGSDSAGTDGWFGSTAFTFIYSMVPLNSHLFVAGSFQNANGDPQADMVADFDGVTWRSLGSNGAGNGPLNANGLASAVFGNRVYVGGSFTSAGGDSLAQYIAAFPTLRPDARVGTGASGPFTGNNVYNTTGSGQSKTILVKRGARGSLFIDFQNDGLLADTFKIRASGSAKGFAVNYIHGARDVTASVKSGAFSTGNLAPGAHVTLKMVVKLSRSSAGSGTYFIRASSKPDISPDTIKAVFKPK